MSRESQEEGLRIDSARAVRMLRRAVADRAAAQKRVVKWRAKCGWLCEQGASWKRSWFRVFVPPGLGD